MQSAYSMGCLSAACYPQQPTGATNTHNSINSTLASFFCNSSSPWATCTKHAGVVIRWGSCDWDRKWAIWIRVRTEITEACFFHVAFNYVFGDINFWYNIYKKKPNLGSSCITCHVCNEIRNTFPTYLRCKIEHQAWLYWFKCKVRNIRAFMTSHCKIWLLCFLLPFIFMYDVFFFFLSIFRM